jgi:NAD(P)H-hydrate epimerase
VAIGPGLGRTDEAHKTVSAVLGDTSVPVVVDADALNALADDPSPLVAREDPTVITPHPAELGRLLGITTSEVQADRPAAAAAAAERFGCVVLLKGRGTIVHAAEAPVPAVVVTTGGPELATAGTGDVLTGAIAALLPHVPDWPAAAGAAYIHGLAGAAAAVDSGREGVTAWDVAEQLGRVRDDLEVSY